VDAAIKPMMNGEEVSQLRSHLRNVESKAEECVNHMKKVYHLNVCRGRLVSKYHSQGYRRNVEHSDFEIMQSCSGVLDMFKTFIQFNKNQGFSFGNRKIHHILQGLQVIVENMNHHLKYCTEDASKNGQDKKSLTQSLKVLIETSEDPQMLEKLFIDNAEEIIHQPEAQVSSSKEPMSLNDQLVKQLLKKKYQNCWTH
jgi:hypothetical protein